MSVLEMPEPTWTSGPCPGLWLLENGVAAAVGVIDRRHKLGQPFKKPWVEKSYGEGKLGYPNTVDFYFLKRQKINELYRFQMLEFFVFGV